MRIGTERQLFLDDHLIERMAGLRRTVSQPSKFARNPLLVGDSPWAPQGPMMFSLIRDPDDGLFKAWLSNYTDRFPGNEQFMTTYVVSRDGLTWDKPALGLIEFGGSTANNICFKGASNCCGFAVVKDPCDPDPSRRYKAAYWDTGEDKQTWGVCVAFSPDGLRWTAHPGNPVVTGTGDTHTLLGLDGFDPAVGKYVGYFRPGGGPRRIGRSVSDDFVHWSDVEVILAADEEDPDNVSFYGMDGFIYEGLHIGFLWVFHNDEEPQLMDIQLVCSRDGSSWTRVGDRQVFLPRGEMGDFDCYMVQQANPPIVVGNELWIYYSGNNGMHWRDVPVAQSAIGLATLRLDGFVSLDAGEEEGTVLTKPLEFEGGQLLVNADASAGQLTAELVNAEGQAMEGFTRTDCDPLTRDSLRHTITWGGRSDLREVRQPVRIGFYLRKAKLYSFAFGAR
jgi:hypothetical protein